MEFTPQYVPESTSPANCYLTPNDKSPMLNASICEDVVPKPHGRAQVKKIPHWTRVGHTRTRHIGTGFVCVSVRVYTNDVCMCGE